MNNFAILSIFLFFFIQVSHQQIVPLQNDSIAVEFIVQVERVAATPGGFNTYIGTGTLLTFHHVLTTRTIYTNLTLPNDVVYRFRGVQVGDGLRAQAAQIILHPTADMAIARFNQRVDQQFIFAPRNRGLLPLDRFCTLFGYRLTTSGISSQYLMMTPVVVRTGVDSCNATGIFCANGAVEQFQVCDSLIGAPVICDGNTVAGLVTVDNFCAIANPRLTMIALNDFNQWINDQTAGGAKGNFGNFSVIGAILSVFLIKIFT